MVKEKRKARLEKGAAGGGEFIGFGAFANTSNSSTPSSNSKPSLKWSPVFTPPKGNSPGSGSADSSQQLGLVLKKISQKRDGQTKARALAEVEEFLSDSSQPKKLQVQVLAHLVFLYHSKLHYDDAPMVRASALSVLTSLKVIERLPKAWKTLVVDEHSELFGMLWCAATGDPSMEVQTAVGEGWVETIDASPSSFLDGLLIYLNRILRYGRAKAMKEDLFFTTTVTGEETAKQREAMEERYERIVGTALDGMQAFVNFHPEVENQTGKESSILYEEYIQDNLLWKLWSSQQSSLRRRTHFLMGVLCRSAPSLVYTPTGMSLLSKVIPMVVAKEKEPGNLPALFDFLVLFWNGGSNKDIEVRTQLQDLENQLLKPLKNILSKACFGASLNVWGPTMLPLVANLYSSSHALVLLSVLWEGREASIGLADQLGIATAVAECSSYLLLRKNDNNLYSKPEAEQLTLLWLSVLEFYMMQVVNISPVAREPLQRLEEGLGAEIWRIHRFSTTATCSLSSIREWFWTQRLPNILLSTSTDITLNTWRLQKLLVVVLKEKNNGTSSEEQHDFLVPIIRRKFHELLNVFQRSSGSVPDLVSYRFFTTALQYAGVAAMFVEDSGETSPLDKFLTNDLLRWILLHTTHLKVNQGVGKDDFATNAKLAQYDYQLYRTCLLSMSSPLKQKAMWNTLLQEIISSEPDLLILSEGLQCLLGGDPSVNSLLRSEKFDSFVRKEANRASTAVGRARLADDPRRKKGVEAFLQLSCGLSSKLPLKPLISNRLIHEWVDLVSPAIATDQFVDASLPNPTLEALLSLMTINESHGFSKEEQFRILLSAWREGGTLWTEGVLSLFATQEELRDSVAQAATKDLLATLREFLDSDKGGCTEDELTYWSERAYRVATMVEDLTLEQVGLAHQELWDNKQKSEILRRCLFKVLGQFQSDGNVLKFMTGTNDSTALIVSIFCAISRGDVHASMVGTRKNDERILSLISLCGGKEAICTERLDEWIDETVKRLSISANSFGTTADALKETSLLSQLISVRFGENSSATLGKLEAHDIVKGECYGYINNPDTNEVETAIIRKVHDDDFPNLYFTIQLVRDGREIEKQTVVNRLRRIDNATAAEKVEAGQKYSLGITLMDKIIKPVLTAPLESSIQFHSGSECLSILLSQVGLGGKGGIGTLRYEAVQLVSKIQENAVRSIESEDREAASTYLFCLASAMGLGCVTPSSRTNISAAKLDPRRSVEPLLRFIKAENSSSFSYAVLCWLSIALPAMEDDALQAQVADEIFSLSYALLDKTGGSAPSMNDALVSMRGFQEVSLLNLFGRGSPDEEKALSALIFQFCSSWKQEDRDSWMNPFSSIVHSLEISQADATQNVLQSSCEVLVSTGLRNRASQWLSFRLLIKAASFAAVLHDTEEVEDLSRETLNHLDNWTSDLTIDEEADEIEDDVVITNRWLPHSLMNELGYWIDDDLDHNDEGLEQKTIHRMLAWLTFLEYLEAAAGVDVRNRTAFGSYIILCCAVTNILDLMLLYIPIGEKTFDVITMDELLSDEVNLNAEKLSSLVLFRTFEVFPSLSKKWWEEDCPRSVASAVSAFVTAKVAPETLRRELARINTKSNSVLGEMAVSGSLVSREVTASYFQDECKLSVVIKIPTDFPLRNVELDGQLTRGISDKRWKRWELQIRTMLNNQDGTLLDALLFWKKNIDNEFDGVEPCPVCYSVLSVKTYELPNLECNTCKNCFHSNCLYTWFNSSGNSKCVICQQPWSGTRIQ